MSGPPEEDGPTEAEDLWDAALLGDLVAATVRAWLRVVGWRGYMFFDRRRCSAGGPSVVMCVRDSLCVCVCVCVLGSFTRRIIRLSPRSAGLSPRRRGNQRQERGGPDGAALRGQGGPNGDVADVARVRRRPDD